MAGKPWSFFVHKAVDRPQPQPQARVEGMPEVRRLRVFTQDPSVARLDGAITTLQIPFEPLDPGPAGAYFVVTDRDEDEQREYGPVDLEKPAILMRDGLDPSTTDRAFACQMTYAVAMETYDRFTRALGRDSGFGPIPHEDRRLRLVPRAFNDANAYYDREAGAVLFGWDTAKEFAQGRSQPGGNVFLCLSRDIIAHEVTHAMLDGLRPNFLRPTHADVSGLHEGISDLVAIFLHFTQHDIVAMAIESTQGSPYGDQLSSIGHQFGFDLIDGRNPLRTAVHATALDGQPLPAELRYRPEMEEHDLGSVLVSAVFEAYRRVFERQTRTLKRVLATYQGRLPSEGIDLLAAKASRLAGQFLNLVIRAIDYCPSLHCSFGEYLRAMVTGDFDLIPADPWAFREALVTSFRRFGVLVPDVEDLSEKSLLWRHPRPGISVDALRFDRLNLDCNEGLLQWNRDRTHQREAAAALGRAICNGDSGRELGLVEPGGSVLPISILSLRTLRRVAPDGGVSFDLVAEVAQKRKVREGFFFGGCTLVIGPGGQIRYAVVKDVDSRRRLKAQRDWLRTQPDDVREAAWAEHSGVAAARLRRIHLEK